MAKTVRLWRRCRCLAVPLILAFALLFVFVPATFAATATSARHQHHALVGPKSITSLLATRSPLASSQTSILIVATPTISTVT